MNQMFHKINKKKTDANESRKKPGAPCDSHLKGRINASGLPLT